MSGSKSISMPAGGRRAVTLLCVLLIFGTETLFTTALPLFGTDLQVGPALVGLALSLSSGAGYLVLPLVVHQLDGRHLRRLMIISGAVMLVSCGVVIQAQEWGVVALLCGSLGFGIARITGVVGLLTMVARLPGRRSSNQGWNGSLQRFGSLGALLISSVLFATRNWTGVFITIAVMIAFWCALADKAALGVERERRVGATWVSPVAADAPSSQWNAAFSCVTVLRRPEVLASAMLNLLMLLTLMHGNSFFSIAFARDLPGPVLSSVVVTSLMLRDGISVLSGLVFPFALRRLGTRVMLWSLPLLAVLPFALLVSSSSPATGSYVAAVAHGIMAGWGIAATNLLASGTNSEGVGKRIAGSLIPTGVVMLVAPAAFGGAVATHSVQAAYALLIAVIAASGAVMVWAGRHSDLAE
ncbi:MFS transporter [Microbacterium maritypicum]|uniref:MFS transporter n=1 Tax=Microbacterium maritypicum TaxID=33918 RepID=UPI001B340E4B|nr:MFS transporter [Microbacterium liquefaciens]MBP5801298.1 MFS transporter [Microbacterium liquefaciens]